MTNKYSIKNPRKVRQLYTQIEQFLVYAPLGERVMMKPTDSIYFGRKNAFSLEMSGKFVSVRHEDNLGYRVAIYEDSAQESPVCTLRPSPGADGVTIEYGSAAVSASVVVERGRPYRSHLLTAEE